MENNSFRITDELLAPKGVRLANYLIDLLAATAVFIILMFAIGFVYSLLGLPLDWIDTMEDWKYNLVFCVIYFFYCTIFESYGGRTIGKLITGTMVVTEDGERPEPQNIAGRSLCRFIPFDNFSFLGNVGWHDKISGTRVVKKHIYVIRKNQVVEMDEIGKDSEVL